MIGTHLASDARPRPAADNQVSRRELRQLKWLTALVPGSVALIYEFARQEALEHILPALPVQYGNIVVWVLVLLLSTLSRRLCSVSSSGSRRRRSPAAESWRLSVRSWRSAPGSVVSSTMVSPSSSRFCWSASIPSKAC